MDVFKTYDDLFAGHKSKKLTANYNRTLMSLLTYEKRTFADFTEQVNLLRKEMQNQLIAVDANQTKSVNLSQDVLRVFQEAAVLDRFGFELPQGFDSFMAREASLKLCRSELANLLIRYDIIMKRIGETFPDLFADAKQQLEAVIQPGEKTLT
jgi:hypothetical protein